MKKLLSAVAIAGAVTAATLAGATTAAAAPSPDDAVAICGGGYVEEEAYLSYGTVYLVYDDASATHCVVTMKEVDTEYPSWMCASIDDEGVGVEH